MNVISLRPLTSESTPVQCVGRLVSAFPNGQLEVEADDGNLWACRRAASCLLKPEIGDTVLLSGPNSSRVYLIAVIEQADAAFSCLEVPGNLTLAARAGAVSIEGHSDIHLRSGGALNMQASRWGLKADKAECDVSDLRYTGESVDGTVGRLRLVGKLFETVAERVVQMARSALRLVDESDQVRAGHLDLRAQESLTIHGKHVVMTGKELMKVDASQIHMG